MPNRDISDVQYDRVMRFYDLNRVWEGEAIKHLVIINGGGAAGIFAYAGAQNTTAAHTISIATLIALLAFGAGLLLSVILVFLTYKNCAKLQREKEKRYLAIRAGTMAPEGFDEPVDLDEKTNIRFGFLAFGAFIIGMIATVCEMARFL